MTRKTKRLSALGHQNSYELSQSVAYQSCDAMLTGYGSCQFADLKFRIRINISEIP